MTKGLQNPHRENPRTQVQGFPHRNHSSMAVKPQEKVRQDSKGLGRLLFRVAVWRVGAAPAAAPAAAPLSVPYRAHSCRSSSQDKDHRYNNVTHMCRQICQHCVHLPFRIRSALWSVRPAGYRQSPDMGGTAGTAGRPAGDRKSVV